jgi:hypothetical protein
MNRAPHVAVRARKYRLLRHTAELALSREFTNGRFVKVAVPSVHETPVHETPVHETPTNGRFVKVAVPSVHETPPS